jgi:hypothetical protein
LALEGDKLLILFSNISKRKLVKPRWNLSITDEVLMERSNEFDLDSASDFLEKSLTSERRSILAFLSVSDHLEIFDFDSNELKF